VDDAPQAGGPLERYIAVLELVAAFPGAITVSDVGSLLALPKTTAHRLLGGLARSGLIKGGDGRNRTFRLADRLVRLVHMSADGGWIEALVRPQLEALAAERGETCYVSRLLGHRVHVAVTVSPEVRWRAFVQPGIEMPPHAAATAKVILAFQSPALVARALAEPLPRLTSQTRTDPELIRAEYADVRVQGYATCISEIDEGLGALGVPIVQTSGEVLHSVGIVGPVPRIMNDAMAARIDSLRATAARLSLALSLGSAIAARTVELPQP
jgi:DNA-binding IclR family transcriptional regulator